MEFGLAVADLNGDGKLDLALGDSGLVVSVLLGKGDGTFQAAVKYGQVGWALAVGDFNGDGGPDLAVTPTGSSGVVILAKDFSPRSSRGNEALTSNPKSKIQNGASLLLRKWDWEETLALTPALSPRRGGSTHRSPEFSRSLEQIK